MTEENKAQATEPVDRDFLVKESLLNQALNQLTKLPYSQVKSVIDGFLALRAVNVKREDPAPASTEVTQ